MLVPFISQIAVWHSCFKRRCRKTLGRGSAIARQLGPGLALTFPPLITLALFISRIVTCPLVFCRGMLLLVSKAAVRSSGTNPAAPAPAAVSSCMPAAVPSVTHSPVQLVGPAPSTGASLPFASDDQCRGQGANTQADRI